MQVSTVGLDIAKNVFQVHGVDEHGRTVLRRKVSRGQLLKLFSGLEPCLVGMEACATAHHWARELSALGHEVRLMPPAYVKVYVKRNKNDAADAEAICEAVRRPTMRFVPIKSAEAQSVLMLHRARHLRCASAPLRRARCGRILPNTALSLREDYHDYATCCACSTPVPTWCPSSPGKRCC